MGARRSSVRDGQTASKAAPATSASTIGQAGEVLKVAEPLRYSSTSTSPAPIARIVYETSPVGAVEGIRAPATVLRAVASPQSAHVRSWPACPTDRADRTDI